MKSSFRIEPISAQARFMKRTQTVAEWKEKDAQRIIQFILLPEAKIKFRLPTRNDWRHRLNVCLVELDKAIKLGGMEDEVKQVERQMSELKMQE
jgi:hypothetical protein